MTKNRERREKSSEEAVSAETITLAQQTLFVSEKKRRVFRRVERHEGRKGVKEREREREREREKGKKERTVNAKQGEAGWLISL